MNRFIRRGHPERVGKQAVVRSALVTAFVLCEEEPYLFQELADAMRDEMEARGVTLDRKVMLPRLKKMAKVLR